MLSKKEQAEKAESHYLFYQKILEDETSKTKIKDFKDAAEFWLNEYLRNTENDNSIFTELGVKIKNR